MELDPFFRLSHKDTEVDAEVEQKEISLPLLRLLDAGAL